MPNYKKYATLKSKIEELTAQLNEVKKEIVGSLDGRTETRYGTFTPYAVISYSYSEKVQDLADRLAIAKTREEEKGIATVKNVTAALRFTANTK